MRHLFYVILGIVAIFASFPAFAQACFPRAALLLSLEQNFEEVPRMRAMTSRGHVVEMLAAPSGSWTIVVTRPDGLSCAIAEGTTFEFIEPVEGDPA
jgi:hypothetical protein